MVKHVAAFIGFALFCMSGVLPAHAEKSFVYSSAQAEIVIAPRANGVIAALKNRQMNRLAQFVHPQNGLRFSPYVFVSRSHLAFSREKVRRLGNSDTRYLWGEYDGTGNPIRLTWREYFQNFIYSRDFAASKEIRYNVVRNRGNTVNNLHAFYPGSIVVEYYTPGSKTYDGMDWQSLWLVFQPRGTTWYLVGIAHDQWTI
jgi:hypothetical protein